MEIEHTEPKRDMSMPVAIIIAVLALIVVGVWYYYQKNVPRSVVAPADQQQQVQKRMLMVRMVPLNGSGEMGTAVLRERNGKVERMHRTLAEECYWRFGILGKSLQEMNYRQSQYLDFYNYKRRHTGMGMNNTSPFTRLTSYLKDLPLIQPPDVNLTLVQYIK